MKHIKIIFFLSVFIITLTISSFAFSPNWFKEGNNWKIKDGSGNVITNAWLCDDTETGKPWYLLDSSGNIVIGLAQDHGNWYFLGPDGKLKTTSGYYDGVYLDMDSSGAIKNLEYIAFLVVKHGNCSVVNTTGSIYASLFSSYNFNIVDTNMPPSYKDGDARLLRDDDIWDDNELNAFISQVLSEFDSSHLQHHAGKGMDATTIIDPLRGYYIWTVKGQPLYCAFVDPVTGERRQMMVDRLPEDIRWVIYKMRK